MTLAHSMTLPLGVLLSVCSTTAVVFVAFIPVFLIQKHSDTQALWASLFVNILHATTRHAAGLLCWLL